MASPVPVDRLISHEQIEYLKTVDSPTIANALETFNVRDRTEGYIGGAVRSMFPDLGVMVGYALTATITNQRGETASRDGYWKMWETLEQMPRPSVVVMQDFSGEPSRCAYAGEVMATIAQRLGAIGMVTDGGFRDLAEVRALGMHYFAKYAVVSHGNNSVVDVGVPVTLDGQRIEMGDILHGDANGIVIVPASTISTLGDAVNGVRDRERRLIDFVKSDRFNLEDAKANRGY